MHKLRKTQWLFWCVLVWLRSMLGMSYICINMALISLDWFLTWAYLVCICICMKFLRPSWGELWLGIVSIDGAALELHRSISQYIHPLLMRLFLTQGRAELFVFVFVWNSSALLGVSYDLVLYQLMVLLLNCTVAYHNTFIPSWWDYFSLRAEQNCLYLYLYEIPPPSLPGVSYDLGRGGGIICPTWHRTAWCHCTLYYYIRTRASNFKKIKANYSTYNEIPTHFSHIC